jgi:hypothetical protein
MAPGQSVKERANSETCQCDQYPLAHLTIFAPRGDISSGSVNRPQLNALNIEVVHAAVSVHEGEALFQDCISYSGHLVDEPTTSAPKYQGWLWDVLGRA